MSRWLLAAEADKIQDFIFRSSRLVQVAGGSGLLTRFCKQVPPLIIEKHTGRRPEPDDPDIIIADGGSFRLAFSDQTLARAVGLDLAEAYYRATDGSLTVAEPQRYDRETGKTPDSFWQANKAAAASLRTKKADQRNQATASAHLPYSALCVSCGVLLASQYRARHPDDQPNYLCTSCYTKAAERDMIWQAPKEERFLSLFRDILDQVGGVPDLPQAGSPLLRHFFPGDADQVGRYDPRGYVAYLVADGNGMGVFFDQCESPAQMKALSNALTETLWRALAEATSALSQVYGKSSSRNLIPALPLIVGGDDLFALVAAPYALDFARQVCLAFEAGFRVPLGNAEGAEISIRPTMSAAVVICKRNYPYGLAHRLGKTLLDDAKMVSRSARLQHQLDLSAVNFALVKGSDLDADASQYTGRRKHIVPNLRPYWVTAAPLPDNATSCALDLQCVLDGRYDLRALPGKRRAELRSLFSAGLPVEQKSPEVAYAALGKEWKPALDALLSRVGRRPGDRDALQSVLGALGDTSSPYYPWRRFSSRSDTPYAHGLLDLLECWDYALDLQYSPEKYEEEGR